MHQNQQQVVEIANILNKLKYNVDVVDYEDVNICLENKYDLILDIHPRKINCYDTNMKTGCLKVAYITGSNPKYNNRAELKRIDEVNSRRNHIFKPHRLALEIDHKIEEYDGVLLIGNKHTKETFSDYDIKKYYQIVNSGYSFPNKMCFDKKRSNAFLYFAGGGAIHKGLGLLLDVFAEFNEFELYVACDLSREKDFVEGYKKELSLANVHYVGFLDIFSDQFDEISNICSYSILPSCAEGMAGSVLACMSKGLIPICSKECGFDEGEVELLADCQMDTLKATIEEYACKNLEWIKEKTLYYKKISENKFDIKNFRERVKSALEDIISKKGNDDEMQCV